MKPHVNLHLQHKHYVKLTITCGCLMSAVIMLLFPGHEAHATVIATATNVYWAWA